MYYNCDFLLIQNETQLKSTNTAHQQGISPVCRKSLMSMFSIQSQSSVNIRISSDKIFVIYIALLASVPPICSRATCAASRTDDM